MSHPAPQARALVIDDDEINREIAQDLLDMHDVSADQAEEGMAGLAMLRKHKYDLVLLDVSMPGLDGEAVCKIIREDPAIRDTYVVAYTAHAFPGQGEHFLAAGFNALLTKPISYDGVSEMLAPVLAARTPA